MRKKTIIGLAIATILTAYMSVLTLSNQAFAQSGMQIFVKGFPPNGHNGLSSVGHPGLLGGIGFGVAAITKFKAHKENPTQIHIITSGIGVLHKFTP
jgi:mannose/fructose/N-acetylgalactosamine-specific phosphotransferase system component IIC